MLDRMDMFVRRVPGQTFEMFVGRVVGGGNWKNTAQYNNLGKF